MKWASILVAVVVVLSLFAIIPAISSDGAEIPVYFDPSESTIPIGQEFTVNITVGNETNLAYNVTSDEIAFEFNPAVLQVVSVTNGPYLASSGYSTFPMTPTIDNVNGKVTNAAESILGGKVAPTGTGVIWIVTFNATGVGFSHVNFTKVWLAEPPAPGHLLPVTTTNGTIEVYEYPTVSFTVTDTCFCKDTQFTDTTTGGTVPYTYRWDFDNDGTYELEGNYPNPTWHYPAAGSYTARLNVTDANGYGNETSKSVEVFEVPTADFTVTNVCFCEDTRFTDTTTGGTPPYTYEWDFDNDGVVDCTEQNPIYHYPAAGSYTARLNVTDANGCSNATSKSVEIVDCGAVLGTVTEGDGTTAVGGAIVNITQGSALINSTDTNETGAYLITGIPVGSYNVTVSKTYPDKPSMNCASNTTSIEVEAGDTIILDIKLRHIADMYWDGSVNMFDLNILAAAWGTCEGDPEFNPIANLYSADNCINMFDLNIFAAEWGTSYY